MCYCGLWYQAAEKRKQTLVCWPRSAQFPLGSVFQEAWKLFHHVFRAFSAGSAHLTKCDAAGGQDLAPLLAAAPCLFARPRSDGFHQVL